MPTVLIIGGWRVVIYPNDHRPAHVHVIGGGCQAVFNLSGEELEPELRENHGFDSKALRRILAELQSKQTQLISQWEVIHGTNR